MSEVLGSHSFLSVPTVNGLDVLLNAGGVPVILSDTTANRPAAGQVGRLFLDTTLNEFFRDNGASWDSIGAASALPDNPILPGNSFFRPPVGTTAQRPAVPVAGDTRFNSTTGASEEFNGTYWKPQGIVLQMTSGVIGLFSGTTQVPLDNTAPTSTEGSQIWTTTFTPLSATSRIVIQFSVVASNSGTSTNIMSLFAGTTNLGSTASRPAANNTASSMSLNIVHAPGSTATITYSARFGAVGGTWYCNQTNAATMGNAFGTEYTIIEYA